MNFREKGVAIDAAKSIVAFRDLVGGIISETGVEALRQFYPDPEELMAQSLNTLRKLRDVIAEPTRPADAPVAKPKKR